MNHHHHQIPSGVRIQKARTTLLLDHPFFGTLLFRLGAKPSHVVETMATDGISLFYNPDFVETLNAAELAGVLAHEVMHPACSTTHDAGTGTTLDGIWPATMPSIPCCSMPA